MKTNHGLGLLLLLTLVSCGGGDDDSKSSRDNQQREEAPTEPTPPREEVPAPDRTYTYAECSKLTEDQYQQIPEGEPYPDVRPLRSNSQILADVYFNGGYSEGGDEYDRTCTVLNDGRRLLYTQDGKKKWCRVKTLDDGTMKELRRLNEASQDGTQVEEEYGICDGPTYSIYMREPNENALYVFEQTQDCHNRIYIDDPEAGILVERLMKACESSTQYRQWQNEE